MRRRRLKRADRPGPDDTRPCCLTKDHLASARSLAVASGYGRDHAVESSRLASSSGRTQSLDVVGTEVCIRFMCCENRTPRERSFQIRLGGGGRPDVRMSRRPPCFERCKGSVWLLHHERELEVWSDSACLNRDGRGEELESSSGAKGGTDPACRQPQRLRLAVVSVRGIWIWCREGSGRETCHLALDI